MSTTDRVIPAWDPPPAPTLEARDDLGILVVHGIGEQRQGQTLTQMAEPIVAWIREWLLVEEPKGALIASSVVAAALRPPLLEDGTPAHARVEFGVKGPGASEELRYERWLFAEAWWASQVSPPPLGDFTAWLLMCAPWITLFHLNQRWLVRPSGGDTANAPLSPWKMAAIGIFVTFVWWAVSLVLTFVLLLMYVVALMPIGRVRVWFYALLKQLSGIVGDAYVKIRHPAQRHAMEEAVLQGLRWLRPRCRRVAIVAHSQGAAIAHGALKRAETESAGNEAVADLLVTVGSGMVKLSALRFLEQQSASDRMAAVAAPMLMLAGPLAFLRARQLGLADLNSGLVAPGMICVFGIGFLVATWMSVRGALEDLRQRSPAVRFGSGRPEWCDIVASSDVVPQGAVTTFFTLPGVRTRSVDVLRSAVYDHTSYWTAGALFMPALVEELAACSDANVLRIARDDPRFERASRRLRLALRVRALSTWLDFAAVAIPLWLARDRLIGIVDVARGRVRGPRAPLSFLDEFLTSVEDGVHWVVELVTPMSERSSHLVVDWLTAAAGLAVLFVIWRRVSFALWRAWSSGLVSVALRRQDAATAALATGDGSGKIVAVAGDVVLHTLAACVALLPVTSSLVWTLASDWITERRLYQLFGGVWVAVFLVLIGSTFAELALEGLGNARRDIAGLTLRTLDWPTIRNGLYRILGALLTATLLGAMIGGLGLLPDAASDSLALCLGLIAMVAAMIWLLDQCWVLLEARRTPPWRRRVVLFLPVGTGSFLVTAAPFQASWFSVVSGTIFIALLMAAVILGVLKTVTRKAT